MGTVIHLCIAFNILLVKGNPIKYLKLFVTQKSVINSLLKWNHERDIMYSHLRAIVIPLCDLNTFAIEHLVQFHMTTKEAVHCGRTVSTHIENIHRTL